MIVLTKDITKYLRSNGIIRDESPLFSENAGYREPNSGEWLIIDESYRIQDTEHLIEDCVASDSYIIASIIKKYTEEHPVKKDK